MKSPKVSKSATSGVSREVFEASIPVLMYFSNGGKSFKTNIILKASPNSDEYSIASLMKKDHKLSGIPEKIVCSMVNRNQIQDLKVGENVFIQMETNNTSEVKIKDFHIIVENKAMFYKDGYKYTELSVIFVTKEDIVIH